MGSAADDAFRTYSQTDEFTYFRSLSGADVVYGDNGNDYIETCNGGNLIDGGNGINVITSLNDNDTIFGGNGEYDRIFSGTGNDIIFAKNGDDEIHPDADYKGEHDNDIIRGGLGNDTIISYYGDDTYIFYRGDGQDTIYESEGIDKLYFGNNITWSDLQFTRNNNDMVITLLDNNVATTDTITIAGWFEDFQGDNTLRYNNQRIEIFEFKDGSIHYANEILVNDDKFSIIYNMFENNNVTTAENYFSTVNLTSGDNTVTMGENSVNVINFDNWGINAVINNSSANDKIVFGQGITLSNTIFDKYEDRLEVTFTNYDGRIVINDYTSIQFEYSDETLITDLTPYLHSTYTYDDLTMNANLVNVEILGDDDVEITTNSNNNYIKGNSGDNTYTFAGGQDTIEELGGNDKIVFGQGISANDVYMIKDFTNDCLYIKFNNNNNDQITILNYFSNQNNKIETLEFYDETTITNLDNNIRAYIVTNNVTLPSGVSEAYLVGEGYINATGNTLNNTIIGNIGDNSITGGQGNDSLNDWCKSSVFA